MRLLTKCLLVGSCWVSMLLAASNVKWVPTVQTEPVQADADDPAIWVHPQNPSQSLILATDKGGNALYTFDMQGKVVQKIYNIQRPNNVDVEYRFALNGTYVDIAVLTERKARRLRVFAIHPESRLLTDISDPNATTVFDAQEGHSGEPMGIALYRRPKDGTVFAIVSRKTGPSEGYLWQYQLVPTSSGKVGLRKVREFGKFSGTGEIEAVAVDDELGYVYYADESFGIRKYHADPEHPQADQELAIFATTGFQGDREGIAVYPLDSKTGYLLCVDQIANNSAVYVFRREGKGGNPHDHTELVAIIHTDSDSTDGIEASATNFGKQFPKGIMVMMNSQGRNFHLYKWENLNSKVAYKGANFNLLLTFIVYTIFRLH